MQRKELDYDKCECCALKESEVWKVNAREASVCFPETILRLKKNTLVDK